jgi:hydroxyacylglutathione hydrolase
MADFEILPLKTRLSNAYLLAGPESVLLVDAGSPGDAGFIAGALRRLGRRSLDLIYLTHAHYDHFGSAAVLSRATEAPIAIHTDDAGVCLTGETRLGIPRGRGKLARYGLALLERFFPVEGFLPDIQLKDGDNLEAYGFPARVLHTPGHTPGSTCLLLDDGTAFAGDLVSSTGGPHLQRYYAQNWKALASSLAKLQVERPRRVYPGHGNRPLSQGELLTLTGPG